MSDCKTFDALHRATLDGPLDATRQAELDAHLSVCPACMARLQNYVLVTETLKRLEPSDLESANPAPLAEGLVQRILATRKAALDSRGNRATG